jgi:hypothetical protein
MQNAYYVSTSGDSEAWVSSAERNANILERAGLSLRVKIKRANRVYSTGSYSAAARVKALRN